MAEPEFRNIAFLMGLLGALLLILAAVVDFVGGIIFLALNHATYALVGAWAHSVIFAVVGVVIGLFAVIGRSSSRDGRVGSGVVLVVLAVVGWFGLGFGGELLALLGALFTLLAGILYLVSSS